MNQIKYSLRSLHIGISAFWRTKILQSMAFGLSMGIGVYTLYHIASR